MAKELAKQVKLIDLPEPCESFRNENEVEGSESETFMKLTNNSKFTIRVEWIDYEGNDIVYNYLYGGDSYT